MAYRSCNMLEAFFINFNGAIDIPEKECITYCCEPVEGRPGVAFGENAAETWQRFWEKRNAIIDESKKVANGEMTEEERVASAACVHCANFQNADWRVNGMIYYVNLSMYPAPCQCHCMYCDVWENKRNFNFDENTEKAYEKMFETIRYLKEKGKIAPDARWQVSTGEIAIHPYKKQIMELIGNGNATFYTNAFKYDEDIAENLHNNPRSAIDVSIDSGTPETWQKIKGFNNFETVAINLTKYYQKTSRPGQITLKYIVMPGINDNAADYVSLLEIMKILNCSHLTISRDTRKKYNQDEKENQQLCISAGFLAAMCRKQDISIDLFTYTPEERQKVINVANNLLINGKV